MTLEKLEKSALANDSNIHFAVGRLEEHLRQAIVWTRGRFARRALQQDAAMHDDKKPIDCRTALPKDLDPGFVTMVIAPKCKQGCGATGRTKIINHSDRGPSAVTFGTNAPSSYGTSETESISIQTIEVMTAPKFPFHLEGRLQPNQRLERIPEDEYYLSGFAATRCVCPTGRSPTFSATRRT